QTEGGCDHAHRVHEFIHGETFEDRNVFEDIIGHLRFFLRSLTAEHSRETQYAHNNYCNATRNCSLRSEPHVVPSAIANKFLSGGQSVYLTYRGLASIIGMHF